MLIRTGGRRKVSAALSMGTSTRQAVNGLLMLAMIVPAGAQRTRATFAELQSQATAARENEQTDEALRDYRAALAQRPEWAEGWWYSGVLEYEANQYSEAATAFNKLLTIRPQNGLAWALLGLSDFELKKYGPAQTALEKAQTLGIEDQDTARVALYHLALLQNRNGEFDRAFATLAAAFGKSQLPSMAETALGLSVLRIPLLPNEVDPSKDGLIQAAGHASAQLLQPKGGQSLSMFQQLVAQYPSVPYLHTAYAMTLAANGRLKEAIDEETLEIKISPRSALPRIQRSGFALRLGENQTALQDAQRAVALAPDLPAAREALAAAYQATGDSSRARTERQKAKNLRVQTPIHEERMLTLYRNPALTQSAEDTGNAAALDRLAQQAAAAHARGNDAEAIRLYQRGLAQDPDWQAGLWNLSMLDYANGRFAQAIPLLKKWLAQSPNEGTAWAVLGLSEFATGDYANALAHLEQGQQLGLHGNAQAVQVARYHLAILLNRDGQFEKAKALLETVDRTDTLQQKIESALGISLLRIPKLPGDLTTAQRALAQQAGVASKLIQNSKFDDAFQQFQKLIQQYPDQPFLHYAYGVELESLSRYAEAAAQFQISAKLAPDSELPQVELARVALNQQDAQAALNPAQRAVDRAPNSAAAHYILGRTFLGLSQTQLAIHELHTASLLQPDSPEIHFSLAQAYAKAGDTQRAAQERTLFLTLKATAPQAP
jgi:tetratricopeptide (TPR) repeat protein